MDTDEQLPALELKTGKDRNDQPYLDQTLHYLDLLDPKTGRVRGH